MSDNPLQKYFRQPKIYLSLPTGGKFYPPGLIKGDPSNLPVFGMTAMDEIVFKTPDALFSGEATVQVIKSCIPAIEQPWLMPQLDVDACLIAIRIATYGQTLETAFTCKECGEDNKFDLDLSKTLDYFTDLKYDDSLIVGPLMVKLKPLNYREVTELNMDIYNLRKQLYNSTSTSNDDKESSKKLNEVYKKIAEYTASGYKKSIQSVETDETQVNDPTQIEEWLKESDKEFFDKIKEHLEKLSKKWTIQPQTCNCVECEAENTVAVGMDNSNFFVKV